MKNNATRRVLAVTLLAVVVYAVFAVASDVRHLRDTLATFQLWSFAAALGLAFCNYVLRFFKWEYYLRRLGVGSHAPGEPYRPLPTIESFVLYVAGFSMSITPGKAGEVFRSALLLSARGAPVERTAPIVVADRLTDLLSLILLVALGSLSFPGGGYVTAVASCMVVAVLLFVFIEPLARFAIDLVARLPVGARIAPKLRDAYLSLRIVTTPFALVWATVLSAIAWGMECAGLWLIARGLGYPVSFSLAFFAYGTATIAGAIAMLPGGLGGTELVMQRLLGTLGGLPTAGASAAVLLVRFATLWFAVVLGFVALAIFRRRYDRQLGEAVPTAPAPAPTP